MTAEPSDAFRRAFAAGVRFQRAGHAAKARKYFLRAASIQPWSYAKIGMAALEAGDWSEAREIFADVVSAPTAPPALVAMAKNNLGKAESFLGRRDLAEQLFAEAYRMLPSNAAIMGNIGLTHLWHGRTEDAMAWVDMALAADPKLASARFTKSMILLLEGRWLEGWPLYDARWDNGLKRQAMPMPEWNLTDSLEGKTIIVADEQGVGDMIMAARWIPRLLAMGARVKLAAHRKLAPMLAAAMPEISGHFETGEPIHDVDADLWVPCMSLLKAFQVTPYNIPDAPYLRHPKAFFSREKPRIGLVWKGSPYHQHDAYRSVSFDTIEPIICPGASWYSLQVGEPGAFGNHGIDIGAGLIDWIQTAEAVGAMDLVISVDTSVAHLAGALGIPCWLMLQYAPDWRWLQRGAATPWYPAHRLFRQPTPGDWGPVIDEVKVALKEEFNVG